MLLFLIEFSNFRIFESASELKELEVTKVFVTSIIYHLQLRMCIISPIYEDAERVWCKFLADCKPLAGNRNPTCFISYCWGPTGAKQTLLKCRIKSLVTDLQALGAVVYFDEFHLEQDINEFMLKLRTCDYVFIIGTPEYNKRLQEEKEPRNNLQVEFDYIKERIEEGNANSVVPLVFSASRVKVQVDAMKEALPFDYLNQQHILIRDCRGIHVDSRFVEVDVNKAGDFASFELYIKTMSDNARSSTVGFLGIIPSILHLGEGEIGDRYATLRENLLLRLRELEQNRDLTCCACMIPQRRNHRFLLCGCLCGTCSTIGAFGSAALACIFCPCKACENGDCDGGGSDFDD